MEIVPSSDCTDALLDMVCYEALIKRLSPEMEEMFERHLRECRSCRQKMAELRLGIQSVAECPNFG